MGRSSLRGLDPVCWTRLIPLSRGKRDDPTQPHWIIGKLFEQYESQTIVVATHRHCGDIPFGRTLLTGARVFNRSGYAAAG